MEAVVFSVSGFQGFTLHVGIQQADRGRRTLDHVGNFCGLGLEVAYTSSPDIPFLLVLKTEQSKMCLTTQKPSHFSLVFAYPSSPFPILLFIARILE